MNYDYSNKLAESWGVSLDLVSKALEDDNAQRLSQQNREKEDMQMEEPPEGEHITLNFDSNIKVKLSFESD